MALTTADGYIAASKQSVQWFKSATRTTIAAAWFSVFDLAGTPGAGTLAGSSTTAGVVPTDATAGYPLLNAFSGANIGYLSRVVFGSSVACRITVFDRLFLAGAYAFNANTALTAQPSYSGRLPSGPDYTGIELWVEQVTAATGNQAVNVTYTNQAGTGSRTTGAVGIGAAPTVGRCWQLPLQSGDTGLQKVDNVAGSVATVGTFNVMVLRQLWSGRVRINNDGGVFDYIATGLPQLFDTSALYVLIAADSTSSGVPDLSMQVTNA